MSLYSEIPTIETKRLILRAFREKDAPFLAEIHGDAEVMRYMPYDRPDASKLEAWKLA